MGAGVDDHSPTIPTNCIWMTNPGRPGFKKEAEAWPG